MEFFFRPNGIAVIGATTNPVKGGNILLRNLADGFKGGIYPVNPRYSEIEGLSCYSSVKQVPDPVDLAIVFIPAETAPGVIRECADRGIKGVMIESGGFAETGKHGAALQEAMMQVARETGIRLWGPNCMGLVDVANRYVFSFVTRSIWHKNFIPGKVSLIVQSGMLSGVFLIDAMTHGTLDISKVCSIGNKMDVDECDILEYMIDDDNTGVIGLYVESINNGRRFAELCRRSQKPVVVLKGGKSVKGAEAAMSHTASLAGNGAVVSGVLAQVGATEATDFKQMMDICRSSAMFPKVPGSGRVAVITYSGGSGIVSSDFIELMGLELAELSQETKDVMKRVYPEWMPVSNPLDLWPAVERNGAEESYGTAVRAVCDDPNADAILIHMFVGGFALRTDISPLAETARAAGKPIFCWLMGDHDEARNFIIHAHSAGVPVFGELYRAVECMAAVFELKKHIEQREPFKPSETRELAADLIRGKQGDLDEHLSKNILKAYGIPVTDERIVSSGEEARETAFDFGFPVVMKGLAPGIIHKSELGLVLLKIKSAEEAGLCFDSLDKAMSGRGKVLIQKQMHGDPELIVGLIRDPQFGPCVMCGLGGVLTEIMGEALFAVAPLNRSEALSLIGRLKAQKLLDGFRGSLPVDREALAQILISIGELGLAHPQIREIDINPLVITEGKPVAVDASIILDD
ncbi:MAG: acetate--CoA ligase family protein [Desulfobacterales bacterium]|nr:acetate--CoA ligase family protein [Desulfobacterales bacterium]